MRRAGLVLHGASGLWLQIPILARDELPILPDGDVRWREFEDVREQRERVRNPQVRQVLRQSPAVESRILVQEADERLWFRGEPDVPGRAVVKVVKRLLSDSISRKPELPPSPIPIGKGEHTNKSVDPRQSETTEPLKQYLRIGR